MALTNAERQKRHRQKVKEALRHVDALRNAEALRHVGEQPQLRNEEPLRHDGGPGSIPAALLQHRCGGNPPDQEDLAHVARLVCGAWKALELCDPHVVDPERADSLPYPMTLMHEPPPAAVLIAFGGPEYVRAAFDFVRLAEKAKRSRGKTPAPVAPRPPGTLFQEEIIEQVAERATVTPLLPRTTIKATIREGSLGYAIPASLLREE